MGRHMTRFVRVRPGVAFTLRRSLVGWTLVLGDGRAYFFRKRSNGWEWKERWHSGDWSYAFDLRQAVTMADKAAAEQHSELANAS